MKEKGILFSSFETQDLLVLMQIYLSEWMHRDELLWKQVFKYFYATIFVLFLPNIAAFVQIELPNIAPSIFPMAALVLSVVFLYASLGYAIRLAAIGDTYQKLIDLLPERLRRISIKSGEIKGSQFFKPRMSMVLCVLMFLSSSALSIYMLIYYAKH